MADQQPGRTRAAGNRNRDQQRQRAQRVVRTIERYEMPGDDSADGGRPVHRTSRTCQVQVRRRS